MKSIIIGLLLGLLSPFIFFIIGEPLVIHLAGPGYYGTFLLLAACFLICQFRMSRGHADSLRQDRLVMLALNAVPLLTAIIMAIGDDLGPGLGVLLSCIVGTFLGAVAAAQIARKQKGAR